MASRANFLCVWLLPLLFGVAQARIGFLSSTRSARIRIETDESSLLSELAGTLGQSSKARISRIEAQMLPMYTSLPKNTNGTLSPAGVRYALHRFFVQLHGWHVKGLEPDRNSREASSPSDLLKDLVPSHVLALVDQHLDGGGFGLYELALLAASIDDLIHSESIQRLTKAYAAHGVPILSTTTRQTADLILQTYMMFFIFPSNALMNLTSTHLQRVLRNAHKVHRGWNDTVLWVKDLEKSMEHNERMERNPFNSAGDEEIGFASIASIAEEVGGQYGRFQNLECHGMRSELLDMEDGDSGRLLLSSFYGHAIGTTQSQFRESADYLRHLGVLDETRPSRLSVVIPNYVYSRTNCLGASSFYSVCCIDECAAMMVRLEGKIAGPLAQPLDIMEFVAITPSDTVDAPRNLSSTLLDRLNDISKQHKLHGGRIPLHGRLFAQWMHHAYPRECAYPQAPGSKHAPTRGEHHGVAFAARSNGTSWTATREDMETYVNASFSNANDEASDLVELPWSDEEELIIIVQPVTVDRGWGSNALRNLAFVAVLVSAFISLFKDSKIFLALYRGSAASKEGMSHCV